MKKIKIKVHSDKIFAYVAMFSMVANVLSPFAALIPTAAYAEGESVEQTTQTEEAPKEEALAEEPKEETAPVSTEETQEPTQEETTPVETVVEPSTTAAEPAVITEEIPAETLVETTTTEPETTPEQTGDILPDGASDYRPEADISSSEATEVQEVVDPVVEAPKEEVKEYETLADGVEIKDSVKEDWNVDGDKAETKEVVKLGIKYVFPLDKDVSITFTKLPKLDSDRSKLKIERVKVSDLNLPDDFNTNAEYAFDITTPDMDDGEFEYDLTLPKPEGTEAQVSYIEKTVEELKSEDILTDDVKKVDEAKISQSNEELTVGGLDHFTTYFVDTYTSNLTTTKGSYTQGETVYAKGETDSNSYPIRLVFKDNHGNFVQTGSQITGLVVTGSYPLLSSADTGIWSVELQRKKNGNWGEQDTATFTVTIASPTTLPNPSISESCGLDMVLVLDSSDSMSNSDIQDVKDAATTLVNALMPGTPTKVGVIDFDTNVISSLSPTNDKTDVLNAINSIGHTGSTEYTHWEAALEAADTMANSGDLVVIITDGNPTRSDGPLSDLDDAIVSANDLKDDGTRILAIGIDSSGTSGGLDLANLEKITGSNDITIPPSTISDINDVDVVLGDVSDLGDVLADLVTALCGGTITVNKYINSVADENRAGAGWEFNIAGTTKLTDENGQTDAVEVPVGSSYSVVESVVSSGYTFSSASCTGAINNGSQSGNGVSGIQIDNDDIVTCNFVNTENYTPTKICHSTSSHTNPYNLQTPNTLGQLMGHAGHIGPVWYPGISVSWGDIIPPIPVFLPTGLNWSTEGQAFWNNNCNISPYCGDGLVNQPTEQCDDGNKVNSDVCSNSCQFNTGTITIIKDAQPDSNQEFHFTYESNPYPIGGFTLVDDGGDGSEKTTFTSIPVGTYSWVEDGVTGWTLDSITCDDANSTFDLATRKVTVNLEGGENVTCRFTNSRDQGLVTFQKLVDDNSPVTGWVFEVRDQSGTLIGTYHNGDSVMFDTGSYIVSESGPIDYHFVKTSGICSTDLDGITNITVDKEGGTCTFNNAVNRGSITITKDAVPNNDQDFGFLASGNGVSNFYIDDDGDNTNTLSNTQLFSNLLPGAYTISEVLPNTDWSLTSVLCTSNIIGKVVGPFTNTASINLVAGENVSCTYTNTKLPTLTVTKIINPSTDQGLFNLLVDGNNVATDAGNNVTSNPIKVDIGVSHQVSETAGTGTDLNDYNAAYGGDCNSQGQVTLSAGENKNCTITNTLKHGTVTVYKFNDLNGNGIKDAGEPYLPNWDIVMDLVGGLGSTQKTDELGKTIFDLVPGSYSLNENIQDGWSQTAITCNNEPEPSGVGVCHWNEGADKWNYLSISQDNPGHIGNHDNDYAYTGPENPTKKDGDAWCEEHENDPREIMVSALFGIESPTRGFYLVTVEPESNIECNIGNVQLSDIHGVKWNDLNGDGVKDDGEPLLGDWRIFIDDNGNQTYDAGELTTLTANSGLDYGWYWFKGLVPGTYSVCEELQTNWDQTYPSTKCHSVTLPYSDALRSISVLNAVFAPEYNFGNFQKGSVMGCKYNDINGSGIRSGKETDEGITEPQLSGWIIRLYDSSWKKVGEDVTNPYFYFNYLMSKGTYYLCEVMQPGWAQTEPNMENSYGYTAVENLSGDTTEGKYCKQVNVETSGFYGSHYYGFGNVQINPQLRISKKNDATTDKRIGDIVTFTIKVKVLDSKLSDVNVFDLLPKGFEFQDGEWTATSDMNGSYSLLNTPHYASPGTWELGDLSKDEEITLTYKAKIGSDVDPGTYRDLAWTSGQDVLDRNVLGLALDLGKVNDYFVGTEVKVIKDNSVKDTVDVEETKEEEEEVLGASDIRLPATGANTTIINIVLVIGLVGGLLMTIGGIGKMIKVRNKKVKNTRMKKALLTMFALGFSLILTSKVYADDSKLVARIEAPKSPAIASFNLNFVVLDANETLRDIDAQCQKKGPSDSGFINFGSEISVGTLGNSYNCDVNSSVLTQSGTYEFKVQVRADLGPWQDSINTESVVFDKDGPDRPKSISVDKKSDCKYEITVKTADDGQTSYIEVYRDNDKEMNLHSGNLIKTKSIGPDEKYEFTDELYGSDCGERWYYAVIAFDDSGIASDPRAEELVKTVTITKTSTEEVLGALEIPGGSNLPGEGGTTGGQTSTETGAGSENGSVLGEQTQGQNFAMKMIKSPWFWLILIVLAYITARVIKNKNKKK